MKAKDLMTTDVVTCSTDDFLNEASRQMWENDCGFVAVAEDGEMHGVLTDRDICMAAYTRGVPLAEIPINAVMNEESVTCTPDDDIARVHELMRKYVVRRIPVVNGRQIVGVVSLNDLAIAAHDTKGKDLEEVGITLATVCRHREPAGA